MESFLLSINVILPLFLWMLAGVFARQLMQLQDEWILKANNVVFKVFVPALMFYNMVQSDLRSSLNRETALVILYCVAGVLAVFLLLMWAVPRHIADNPTRGAVIQASFRSNTAIYGIPMALTLFGEGNIGIVALVVAAFVPVLNILSVICLEVFRGSRANWKSILRNIVTNPLILSLAAGMLANTAGLALPLALDKAVSGFSGIATPMSFFLLGASFSFAAARQNRKLLSAIVAAKLVFLPLVFVGVGVLLGCRGQYLLAVLICFAPPTSINSFPMACAMGANPEISGGSIVFTSAFSMFTMFLWVLVLNALGLFAA